MTSIVLIGVLMAASVWFIGSPGRIRTVLGFVLITHAINVLLISASTGSGTATPFIGNADGVDPLPQAFILTAIVIGFGVAALLLTLAGALREDDATDPTDDTSGGPA